MTSAKIGGQFFFFGCWNYDNCDPKEVPDGYRDGKQRDYRKGVIDMIRERLGQYTFGIIAGDNAYARYGKTYYKSTIDYGFELLRGLEKKLYDAIGNHEIVATNVLEYEREKGKDLLAIAEDCTIHVAGGFRIITMNTNLLSHKSHDNGEGSVPRSMLMVEKVATWLKKPFAGWTLVVGHEPILSVKRKEQQKVKANTLLGYERLLEVLSLGEQVVYMCADVHEFQAWNLVGDAGKSIPMIVAGTGGAIPDLPMQKVPYPFMSKEGSRERLVGTMVVSQPAYGYCEVGVNREGELVVRYIPLQGCGYKPMGITLQIQTDGMVNVLTKAKRSTPKECLAPVIEQALCDKKDVLYAPPVKQRPSFGAPPFASA
jgi:hypothetical protein